MRSMELLEVMGSIRDKYILEAEALRNHTAPVKEFRPRRAMSRIAAVLAVLLFCAVLLQTPMGAAAVEMVKEGFSKLIDTLFPPKEIVIAPEGLPEAIEHEAQGRDPEEDSMGFAIYVDTERYVMTQEDGAYFIRPIHTDPDLPPCEMEIREYPDVDPMTLGQETKAKYEADGWDMVGDLFGITGAKGCSMDVSNGMTSLDAQEGHYFRDNGKGGTFHIICRYFLEAMEGHGTRFAAMYRTFTLIAPQDTSGYTGGDSTLVEAMRQELAYAAEHDKELENTLLNAMTQADMNIASEQRYTLWLDTFDKLWSALSQTMDRTALDALTEDQLNWSMEKAAVLGGKREELDGGSLTATVVFGSGREMLAQRCSQLLAYLEGTAQVPARKYASDLQPEGVVREFTEAWFRGDGQTIKKYLSSECTWQVPGYEGGNPEKVVISGIKNLDSYILDMANRGVIFPSIEFRPTADSDFFCYLSLTMQWEQGQWKVLSCALEG